jgi:hypothetical protein
MAYCYNPACDHQPCGADITVRRDDEPTVVEGVSTVHTECDVLLDRYPEPPESYRSFMRSMMPIFSPRKPTGPGGSLSREVVEKFCKP